MILNDVSLVCNSLHCHSIAFPGLDPPWSTRDAYIQCEADFCFPGAKMMGAILGSFKHYQAITKHGQAGSRFVLNRHRCSASCLLAPEVELQAF